MNGFSKEDLEALNKLSTSGSAFDEELPIKIQLFNVIGYEQAPHMQTQKQHMHHFFELHFVLNGEMSYTVNEALIRVKAGNHLLISPHTPHMVSSFSDDFIKCSVTFLIEKNEILYDAVNSKSGQAYKTSRAMSNSVNACIKEAGRDTLYSCAAIRIKLLDAIYSLCDSTPERRKRTTAFDARLTKAKHFISDNPNMYLSCEDIAAYCYISAKQLNRIFLKHEGVPLLRYIHLQKISVAERMLRDKSLSILDISEALGFSSVYYFSTFFKKHTGLTPASYRKIK